MAASIVRTSRSHGVAEQGIDLVSRAHALAMVPRVASLEDDHHPLYLHPGRTVLVLLRDAGVTDAGVLAAAALMESEDAEFRVEAGRVEAEMGRAVLEIVTAVPQADSDTLAEALVGAELSVRLVAVAERLDHLRHAHQREDQAWRDRIHAQAVAVYQPIAERTNERLAGRYRHWRRAFERRFLR